MYVPYGYDPARQYDVFYLSHGGWSDETTLMGADESPTTFKNVVDHAIEDGLVRPVIMVMPTYNNLSRDDAELGDAGRLLFPADAGYMGGSTLGDMSLTWYGAMDPNMTVDICNYAKGRALAGETVFIDILKTRIERIRANGMPAEIEVFDGMGHGFGIGTGTIAEGWLDRAVAFWEDNR